MSEMKTKILPVLPLGNGVLLPTMVVPLALETSDAKAAVTVARGSDGVLIVVARVHGTYAPGGCVAKIVNTGRTPVSGRAVCEDPGTAAVPVACRGRGLRRDRHPRAIAAESASRHPILPKPTETPGLCPSRADYGQAAQLPRGAPHRDAVGGPLHGTVCQQSGGGLEPADATTRATDAPVQIRRARAAVSLGAWSCAQPLPCRPSPAPSCSPPGAQNALVPGLG